MRLKDVCVVVGIAVLSGTCVGCTSLAAFEQQPSQRMLPPELAVWLGTYASVTCISPGHTSTGQGTSLRPPSTDRAWFRDALNSSPAGGAPFDASPEQIDECRTFDVWHRTYRDALYAESDLERRRLAYAANQAPGDRLLLASGTVRLSELNGRLHLSMSVTDTEGRTHHLPESTLAIRRLPDFGYGSTIEYERAFVGGDRYDLGELTCTFVKDQVGARGSCGLREVLEPGRSWLGTVRVEFLDLERVGD